MSEDRLNDIKSQIRVRMLGASNGSVVPIDKAISIASVECARLFAEVERLQGTLNEAIDQSGRLGHELNVQDATITTLREKYKVHENKYAVPLVWKSDSRPREEYEGFVIGVDEGAGIRALVQENTTLQAQVEEMLGLLKVMREDNLLLAKKVSALRKLNTAYRFGDQKLADAALSELEALATPAQEEEDKPLFEGKWIGVMGPVEEDK